MSWAAHRQADILLYLGAFFLSVSAVIFVAYQGQAVTPLLRFAILSVYTLTFLGLGVVLHRWARIREAGPVFLALGAILLPVDFLALRSAESGKAMPTDVGVLIASSTCAALYFSLSARGYGRFYAAPAVASSMVAWGALGSVLTIPYGWFGAWYELMAAATWIAGSRMGSGLGLHVRRGAFSVSFVALDYSVGAFVRDEANQWVLPVTLGAATAGLGAALPFRRSVLGLGLIPLTGAATLATAFHAAGALHWSWHPAFASLAGAAYLAIAHLDRRAVSPWWRAAAVGAWAYAIGAAHISVLGEGSVSAALPATYWVTAFGVAAGVMRWRLGWRPGEVMLPALLGGAGAATAWARWDVSPEWILPWAGVAGAGYLVVAHLDAGRRPIWCDTAMGVGLITLATSLPIAARPDVSVWQLPVTSAVILVANSVGVARWRLTWRPGIVALPIVVPGTLASLLWAWTEMPLEWLPAFAALPALGYLMAAHFDDDAELSALWRWGAIMVGTAALAAALLLAADPQLTRWPLPATAAITLAGTAAGVVRWRTAWRPGGIALPALSSGTVAAVMWAWTDLPLEWLPAFATGAATGYLMAAHFDDDAELSALWRWGAIMVGTAALAAALLLAADPQLTRWPLPATAAIALAGTTAGVVRWRAAWRPGGIALPALSSGTVAAVMWAWTDMPLEWLPAFAAGAAAGYLIAAHLDRDIELTTAWRWGALAVEAAALAAALYLATDQQFTRWQLPVATAIAFCATAAGVSRWRFSWRPGLVPLPALASGAVSAGLWAWQDLPLEWLPAFASVGALGYLTAAFFERSHPFRMAWQWGTLATGVTAVTAALILATDPQLIHWQLPVTLGIAFVVATAGVIRWRLAWRPGLATMPLLGAGTGAALLWAWIDMPLEWLGVTSATASLAYIGLSEVDVRRRARWRMAALATGSLGLLGSHAAALVSPGLREPLVITYALVLAGTIADALRRRDKGAALIPALLSASGVAALWWGEVGRDWWAVPPGAVGLGLAATHPLWARFRVAAEAAWTQAALLAAIPGMLFVGAQQDTPWSGFASSTLAAATLGLAAARARGALAAIVGGEPPAGSRAAEAPLLAYAAFIGGFTAAGYLNSALEITGVTRAWAFAAVGSGAWLAVSVAGIRGRALVVPMGPGAVSAFAIAGVVAAKSGPGATAVLVAASVWPAVAFATTRTWVNWVVALCFAALTARAVWHWHDWDVATLPLAYAAAGLALWCLFVAIRRYGPVRSERDATVQVLSWGPLVLSAASAAYLLNGEAEAGGRSAALETTREWAILAAAIAAFAAVVVAEGARLRQRSAIIPGSLGLLVALLMAIATTEPTNIQAFTLPSGLFVLALGLSYRSSPPLVPRHLSVHEALIVAGVLALVLPPAQQSFEPAGGRFGFELIGFGLLFLATGLVIHARWLVPAGILTLTGVAIRWLTGGYVTVPYWLILGVLGTMLIAAGTVVLFERERWDTAKDRMAEWWLGGFGSA